MPKFEVPTEDDLPTVRNMTVTIDASCYGPVPPVKLVVECRTGPQFNEWWTKLDGEDWMPVIDGVVKLEPRED